MNKSSDDLSLKFTLNEQVVRRLVRPDDLSIVLFENNHSNETILWKYLITNALSRFPKVWRVGFMGQNSHTENVDMFLRVFKEALEVVQGRTKSHLW